MISDQSYEALDSNQTIVSPGGYRVYRPRITAPAGGVNGSVTLYSEDASYFDACYVAEI